MELGKLSYDSIMVMPLDRLHSYLKWKNKFNDEIEKKKRAELEEFEKMRKR